MVRKRTVFIFLTLIGLIAYLNSFQVPFHYDDFSFFKEKVIIKSFSLFLDWLSEDYLRLITGRAFLLFTFYLNYVINGLDTFGYHLVNLIIHISTAFLFYLLLSKYVYVEDSSTPPHPPFSKENPPIPPLVKGGKGGFIKNGQWVPILAASLFLLHPINTESVTYISSRSSELSAFFILASMLCFFRATFYKQPINNSPSPSPQSPPIKGGETNGVTPIEGGDLKVVSSPLWKRTQKFPSPLVAYGSLSTAHRGKGRGEGGFMGRKLHAGYYTLSIIFFILGLSTKEAAIVTPVLILLFDLYFISGKENFKSRIGYHVPFWIIILAGSFYYSGYIMHPEMYDRPWVTHIFTELKVFIEYLRLLILPFGLNIDHYIKESVSLDFGVIFSIAIIIGLLLISIFLRHKNKVLSFSIIWFFINLTPFLVIRLSDYITERWVYIAAIGFSLGLSELIMIIFIRHKKIGVIVLSGIILLFGSLTILRNNVYKSPVTLWADALKKSPDKIRPYTNLSASYLERGYIEKAINIMELSIKRGNREIETYINLAMAYFLRDDMKKAEEILLSLRDKGVPEIYHYNLGVVYKFQKEYEKSVEEFKKVLKTKPQSPAILGSIGECYDSLGQKDQAKEYFILATKGIPQNSEDYLMLAKSYFALGEKQKGTESLNKALISDPFNIYVRNIIATTLFEHNYYDQAYKHFSIAAKISPHYAPAYTGMGKAMLAKGNLKEARKHFNKALSLLPPDSPDRKELLELLTKTQG